MDRLSTMAVTVEPENRWERDVPSPVTVGLMAARKQYFQMILRSETPLARAVRVYCWEISSSIWARTERMVPQVPAKPKTMKGIVMRFMNSPKFPQLMPLSSISWVNMPTLALPVHRKDRYMHRMAKMNPGIADPVNVRMEIA